MKISHIEHLGIGVQSIEEALPYFENVLGLKCYAVEEVADQKVKTAFLKCGEVKLELLEPTSPDSTIQKWLDKGNHGVHHVAFCIEDGVANALAECDEKGIRLIDKAPRKAGASMKIQSNVSPAVWSSWPNRAVEIDSGVSLTGAVRRESAGSCGCAGASDTAYSPRMTLENVTEATSAMPSGISRLRRPTSQSMHRTRCRSLARHEATAAHKELLPVPPLPEMTDTICAMPRYPPQIQ